MFVLDITKNIALGTIVMIGLLMILIFVSIIYKVHMVKNKRTTDYYTDFYNRNRETNDDEASFDGLDEMFYDEDILLS